MNENKDINLNQNITIEGDVKTIEVLLDKYILPQYEVLIIDGEKRLKLSLSNIKIKYD